MEYQIRLPEYLAKCVNKDLPQLHCNGQCVLMQKIRKKEKEETQKNLVVYEYSAHYMHKEYTMFRTAYHPTKETDESHFSPYLIDYRFKYNTSIFRPPIS
jgi:hypothetical protein